MTSFEAKKQVRNVERDRKSFVEAVRDISVDAIPAVFEESAVTSLAESLATNKFFILGEMHGAEENAAVIYTLFKQFGFRQLDLEWDINLQQAVDRFLNSGELDFEAMNDSPDGRITANHFVLMRKLRSEGLLEKVVCFDGNAVGFGWNARDAAMERNIMNAHAGLPTLVVAGSLHTKVEPVLFEGESEEKHPMGELVRRTIPDVASGKIEYHGGQFHNYGVRDFDEIPEELKPEGTERGARFYKNESGLYVFDIPNAHAAIVPNPSERLPN